MTDDAFDRRTFRIRRVDRPLTLERHPDMRPDARGFVLDEISVHLDGRRIGHIRTENMPAPAFRRLYPTIFNHMSEIGGLEAACLGSRRGVLYRDLDHADLVKLVCRTRLTVIPGSPYEYEGMSREELLALAGEIEAGHLAGRSGRAFAEFRAYHVDKPFIAFVTVEDELHRRGIGTLLYAEAADWLRERRLILRASDNRTAPARALWQRLRDLRLTAKDLQGRPLLRPHAGKTMRALIAAERID